MERAPRKEADTVRAATGDHFKLDRAAGEAVLALLADDAEEAAFNTGDGGFSAADQTNPNYFYGEYVYLQLYRSTDGGFNSAYIFSGITDAGSTNTANFIAPFILDQNDPNTMLAGGVRLWRSTNVKASTPS